MSIDVVTIPLSRYFSGAYTPPSFRNAWQKGREAEVHHVDGSISVVVKGSMVGGKNALATYHTWRKNMPAYKASLPYAIAEQEWNEEADDDAPSWEVEHQTFGALIDAARTLLEKPPSLFRRMIGDFTTASHLVNARVFVDVNFEKPFQKAGVVFGSLSILEKEFEKFPIPDEAVDVVDILKLGIAQSRSLHLPLILDV